MTKPTLHPRNRGELLAVFGEIAAGFEQVREEISQRDGRITRMVEHVREMLARDPLQSSGLAADHSLRTLAVPYLETIRRQLAGWVDEVENYERNTAFHKRFDDSLLLFVFGKVKAGKSSLGNYLAYGASMPGPDLIRQARPSPEFFWEDGTGATETMSQERMQEKQHFGVGVRETTSSIQGFSLPGLTWVDSPGIHSCNQENGDLTARYASCADLIVFCCSSSHPGRRSDLQEIAALLRQAKPLVILLTHSDVTEPDVDAEGNLISQLKMKAEKDIQDQKDYMQQQLAELSPEESRHLLDVAVYPVSVSFAESGRSDDAWKESGLQAFAARIAELSRSRGLQLKRETPLKNLARFCALLDQSVVALRAEIDEIESRLQATREEIRDTTRSILARMRQELVQEIGKIADRHAPGQDSDGFRRDCGTLLQSLWSRHIGELQAVLEKGHGQLVEHLAMAPDLTLPGFEKRHARQTYESRSGEGYGQAAGGAAGAAAGGAVGSFLGPVGAIFGAALGGYLGGKIGKAAGGLADGEKDLLVEVGDNREDVILDTRDKLLNFIMERLEKQCALIETACFTSIVDWLAVARSGLQELQHVVSEIEKECA